MPKPRVDLTGLKFGRLTVLRAIGEAKASGIWECQCDCPDQTIKNVRGNNLRSGTVQSCGCLSRVRSHGSGKKENGLKQPIYRIWTDMLSRCNNTSHRRYAYYGGRGIKVCHEWNKFELFRDYMLNLPNCPLNACEYGAHLERGIDRIRNNENYKPGNMRWATRIEQQTNMRSNRIVKINGEDLALSEAARRYGRASYDVIRRRLSEGWSLRAAFLTPARGYEKS